MSRNLKEKIRELRKAKGYSLDKLAEITGTSKSYLWELENRESRNPSAEKLASIAEVLGVTTDFLLSDSAEADDSVKMSAFFRKYNKLNPTDQKRIEEMINSWSRDGESSE